MTTTAYPFVTADVFTDRVFGGNPLAVFPEARGLDAARMQRIAREFNLSETVFVLPPEDPRHTRRLRIFTPNTELPFAGHPTVGTAHVLTAVGAVPLTGPVTEIVFEEGVGPVPVTVRSRDGAPVFASLSAAQAPEFGPSPPPAAQVAAMLSLTPADLVSDLPPAAVSCGVPFLFVAVRSRAAVAGARLRRDLWEATLAGSWAPSVFVFAFETESAEADVHARMFAPALGVEEDPATGAAAVALAGLLGSHDPAADATLRWVVEQGVEMGRPSRLEVEADKAAGAVVATRVGGQTVLVSRGEMEVPSA